MKERRVSERSGVFDEDSDRDDKRAQRRRLREALRDAEASPQDATRLRNLLARLDDWTEVEKHRAQVPGKVTRFEQEVALAELAPLMTPQQALSYAGWLMASERGWSRTPAEEEPLAASAPSLARPPSPALPAHPDDVAAVVHRAEPVRAGAPVLAARLRPEVPAAAEGAPKAVVDEVLALARGAGPGEPLPVQVLPADVRQQLGAAAARVRIHTGAAANQAAQRLGAAAFTIGDDIYFAAGQYTPGTPEGDRLLRHELAHVGQYERGLLTSATGAELLAPSSAAEAEASAAEDGDTVEWAAVRRPAHARAARSGQPVERSAKGPVPGAVNEPHAMLRDQLLDAASAGHGAAVALAAAEPATAAAVLRELSDTPVPGQRETALQILARSDGAQIRRLLGVGSHGQRGDILAAPLAPPIGAQVPRARLDAAPTGRDAPVASGGAGRPGRPLDQDVRDQMEFAFGTDFSNVRIHEGAEAQALGAVAFARGEDLYFQPGSFDPSSWQGLELIGHELAHVVQQRAGRVAKGKGGVNRDAALEREADELGGRAAAGERVAASGSGGGAAGAASWAEVKEQRSGPPARSIAGDADALASSAEGAAVESHARLRGQLLEAAATGGGADEALGAAEPATAAKALHELGSTPVPGHHASALQQVAGGADPQVMRRLLDEGSGGQALPCSVADQLAPFVGRQVVGAARLHTDESADLIAAAHQARAVTIGEQIYFASGQFSPGTEPGDELLVHELTHVGQSQRGELTGAAAKSISSGDALTPTEAEADLRARFAVIELHGPIEATPTVAEPSGQPTTEQERGAKLADQQTRMVIATRDDIPNTPTPPPPVLPAPTPTLPQLAGIHSMSPAKATELGAVAAVPAMNLSAASTTSAASAASTTSMDAYTKTFDAPPSQQATGLWDATGAAATTAATADQARFEASLPVLLYGSASPVVAAPPATNPVAPAAAARATVAAPAPAAPAPAPPPAAIAPPTVTDVPVSTTATAQSFEELPTTLAVEPAVGVPLLSELAGAADPVLAQIGQHQAADAVVTAFAAAKETVLTGPGPALVQPAVLDEKLVLPPQQAIGAMPGLPPVPEMAQFRQWSLPGEVQASFDDIAKPRMEAKLAQAKTQMATAEVKRDVDRETAIKDGNAKAQQAHVDAGKKQQTMVAESRIQIANHQATALLQHDVELKKLDAQSDEKKKATVGQIDARVKEAQAKVELDFNTAQQQAATKKLDAEVEVARLKADGQAQYDAEAANAPPEPEGPVTQTKWRPGSLIRKGVEFVADKVEDGWNAVKDFAEKLAGFFSDLIKSIGDAIDAALRFAAEAITTIIDTVKQVACAVIDLARDFLCEALRAFGEFLTSAITLLLGSVFPQLAAALNALIDAAVNAATAAINAIADGLKSVVTALCDTVQKAIDTAITLFRSAVQVAVAFAQALVTGDWSEVALMVLEGVLKLLGIDPEAFYAFVGKTKDSIVKILSNPVAFVRNLVEAVKLGFQQFGDNFLTHLKAGVLEWLFGTLAEAGIQMPTSFDVAGVFGLVAQVLGITWPSLRARVVQQVGEENPEQLQFVERYVEPLLADGFAGLWEQLQQDLSMLWETVIGGAQRWLMEQLVQQAILKIATMWNPAGALVQLIRTAWQVYLWVKENAQRIKELLGAVVDSIADIVAGNISGAANHIESSLAKLVPIVISLFANLIGITGLAGKIKTIILKSQTLVDQAIDKLLKRVKARFKPKPKPGAGTDGKPAKDQSKTIGARIPFQVHGETHTQYIDNGVPMVASKPTRVKAKIEEWRVVLRERPQEERKLAGGLIGKAIAIEGKVDALVSQVQAGTAAESALEAKQRELAAVLSDIWELVPDKRQREDDEDPDASSAKRPRTDAEVHEHGAVDEQTRNAITPIVNQVVKSVTRAVEILAANPSLAGVPNRDQGYLKTWVAAYEAFLSDPSSPPDFFAARYGYAVEALACYDLPEQVAGHRLRQQVSHGHTRPDVVVVNGEGREVAWLDITSSGSVGHIGAKQGAGWKTRGYVAEISYPALDPQELARGSGTLSEEQQQALAEAEQANAARKKDFDKGCAAFRAKINARINAGGTQSREGHRKLITGACRELRPGLPPKTIRGVLTHLGGDFVSWANYAFANVGNDGNSARQVLIEVGRSA